MELGAPTPPTNVRIRYMDGGEDPVHLEYQGVDDDGIDQWLAVPCSPPSSHYVMLLADPLPPHTAVSLKLTNDLYPRIALFGEHLIS